MEGKCDPGSTSLGRPALPGEASLPPSAAAGRSQNSLELFSQPVSYRADIDGLRAISVVPIVFFHFGIGFPGGFTGVDVFFVISGFLITRILLSDLSSGAPFREFWMRRIRRLFPALAFLLAATVVAGQFLLHPALFQSLCRQIHYVLICGANVNYYFTTDYFFDSRQAPLLHTWSLAVEEQFYMIYPCCLWVVWKSCTHIHQHYSVLSALAVVFCISLAASIVVTPTHANFAFYLLPCRAWELTLGGLLVFDQGSLPFSSKLVSEMASCCGVAMVVSSYFLYNLTFPYPGFAALLPCCGSALIISSGRQHSTICSRVLSNPVFVFIGKLSYSWYLWHWPVYIFLLYFANFELDIWQRTVGLLFSLIAAVTSYFWIEQICRSERSVSARAFLVVVGFSWLVLMLLANAGARVDNIFAVFDGFSNSSSSQFPASDNLNVTTSENATVCNRSSHQLTTFMRSSSSGVACLVTLSKAQIAEQFTVDIAAVTDKRLQMSLGWEVGKYNGDRLLSHGKSVILGPALKQGEHPKIAIIGSSHCVMWGSAFEALAIEYQTPIGSLCKDGARGSFSERPKPGWDTYRLKMLDKWHPDLVVWADLWEWIQARRNWELTFLYVLKRAKRLLILGGVPAIPGFKGTSSGLLLQYMLTQKKRLGSYSFINNFTEVHRKRRERIERGFLKVSAYPEYKGRVKFVSLAHLFRNNLTNKLMLIDPCKVTLSYKDCCHINADGAMRAAAIFRTEIFGQSLCQ